MLSIGIALTRMFGIAQMRIQFCFQAAFNHSPGQFFEQTL
jgi:hypothetical protein